MERTVIKTNVDGFGNSEWISVEVCEPNKSVIISFWDTNRSSFVIIDGSQVDKLCELLKGNNHVS